MNRKRYIRLLTLSFIFIGISITTTLVVFALKQNINLFFTPTELINHQHTRLDQKIKVGGIVVSGSLKQEGLQSFFVITDQNTSISVQYYGLLPDLFKENNGVVATGFLTPKDTFKATEILTKHNQEYMPAEVAKATKKWHKNSRSASDDT